MEQRPFNSNSTMRPNSAFSGRSRCRRQSSFTPAGERTFSASLSIASNAAEDGERFDSNVSTTVSGTAAAGEAARVGASPPAIKNIQNAAVIVLSSGRVAGGGYGATRIEYIRIPMAARDPLGM